MKKRGYCYTAESLLKSHLSKKEYVAQEREAQNGPTEYAFSYNGFVDFENYEAFSENLYEAFNRQTMVAVVPPKENQYEAAEREQRTCDICDHSACAHRDSFLMTWKVNWVLQGILKCPYCGRPINPVRTIPEVSLKIHDVRLEGHPARLNIRKTRQWYCDNCEKNISTTRIPGIQHVASGEITLRLLQSIFELSIDGVPNGFIAEGYDLNQDYVGQLCRKFQARTEAEYSKRRDEILANMPAGAFHNETVYICREKYRAIFNKEKDKFLAIFPEKELKRTIQCLEFVSPEMIIKKDLRAATSLYAFSSLGPIRRQILSGLFEALQESLSESQTKHYCDTPEFLRSQMKQALEDDFLNLKQLYDSLTDKVYFQAYSGGKETYLYRSMKKAKGVANFIRSVGRERCIEWRRENETENRKTQMSLFRYFERSLLEQTNDQLRLPVVQTMEQASAHSKYPSSEQLRRLQFYNEAAVFPGRFFETDQSTDYDDELPSLTSSQIGSGVPVACLEHLLHTGLLDKDSGSVKCIRHRQKGLEDSCTLPCPFLDKKN